MQNMTTSSNRFDLIVIGSGPAGQKGAIAAAKLGKRVAMVDRREMTGGVSLHTGTIPSKTLREAVLYLTGYRQRAFYGRDYKLKQEISVADLMERVNTVVARETAVIREQLGGNGVVMIDGTARFTGPHTLEVEGKQGVQLLEAAYVGSLRPDRLRHARVTPARDPVWRRRDRRGPGRSDQKHPARSDRGGCRCDRT